MWARIATAVLGLWLMVAPAILGYDYPARQNDRVIGPIAAAIAIIAIWEVTRPLRWANLMLGLWLLAAPFALGYDVTRAIINDVLVGVLMIILAQMQGEIKQRYGGGWSALWEEDETSESRPDASEATPGD